MADGTRTSSAETASGSGDPAEQEAACCFPVSPLAEILARARADHAQATWLLAMPRAERLEALHRDAALRHLSLARLLSLRAEEAVEDDPDAAEEAAELAVTIAAALPVDPDGRVQRVAALACWLLGKARLRAQPARGAWSSPARLDTVEQAFAAIRHIAASDALSWERALAALGLAQLRWQQRRRVESSAFFALAARHLACSHTPQQLAACRLQHGYLLLGRGELLLARQELAGAQALNPALAPSLAILAALGLAACEAATDRPAAARMHLARARACAPLVPAPSAAIPPAWQDLLEERPNEPQATTLTGLVLERPLLILRAGSPWRTDLPTPLIRLADRLILGRGELEPPLGLPESARPEVRP